MTDQELFALVKAALAAKDQELAEAKQGQDDQVFSLNNQITRITDERDRAGGRKVKYTFQFYDGEEWIGVTGQEFDTPQEAKAAGVKTGFEYVRVAEAR